MCHAWPRAALFLAMACACGAFDFNEALASAQSSVTQLAQAAEHGLEELHVKEVVASAQTSVTQLTQAAEHTLEDVDWEGALDASKMAAAGALDAASGALDASVAAATATIGRFSDTVGKVDWAEVSHDAAEQAETALAAGRDLALGAVDASGLAALNWTGVQHGVDRAAKAVEDTLARGREVHTGPLAAGAPARRSEPAATPSAMANSTTPRPLLSSDLADAGLAPNRSASAAEAVRSSAYLAAVHPSTEAAPSSLRLLPPRAWAAPHLLLPVLAVALVVRSAAWPRRAGEALV